MGGLKIPRAIVCESCNKLVTTPYAARQKFCGPCGIERRTGRSKEHAASRTAVRSDTIQRISETRGKQKTTVMDNVGRPWMQWSTHFSVPFMPDASKNRRWSNTGEGAVFLTKGVRAYHDMVVAVTRSALSRCTIRQNKLWIGLLVEKPNNRFDAINVVDTICDAIKVAADLDDRWFCISKLDWVIKKNDPSIIITIGQESNEDVIACSHCGELKSLENFGLRSGMPLGRARVCRPCKSDIDMAAKRQRQGATP